MPADNPSPIGRALALGAAAGTVLMLALHVGLEASGEVAAALAVIGALVAAGMAALNVRANRAAVDESGRIEMALQTSRHPIVDPVLERVTERRVAYVVELYETFGLTGEAARQHAVIAVSIYLGHVQLARAAPGTLPRGEAWVRHAARVNDLLVEAAGSRS